MINRKEMDMTSFLLNFCYTCPDASRCETEQKCMECREAKLEDEELLETEDWLVETSELLRLYAL